MPSCPQEGTIFEEGGRARFIKEGTVSKGRQEGGRAKFLEKGKEAGVSEIVDYHIYLWLVSIVDLEKYLKLHE